MLEVLINEMKFREDESRTKSIPYQFRKFLYHTFMNTSLRSSLGDIQEATASQKKINCWTTPPGLTCIIWHIPLNALSFSSLSFIFLKEVHLKITKVSFFGFNYDRKRKNNWMNFFSNLLIVFTIFALSIWNYVWLNEHFPKDIFAGFKDDP